MSFDNHWSPVARRMMAGYTGTPVEHVRSWWRWAPKMGLHSHDVRVCR